MKAVSVSPNVIGTSAAPSDVLRRALALVLATLVFGLTLLAVSPAAHERLHGAAAHQADHTCAITLFAHGITASPPPIQIAPALELKSDQIFVHPTDLQLIASKYLLRPVCGPPAV
ncbi:MAG TPA: hypothetical protein VFT72_06700 [Opitutaceae bacterium]|nr:hypothetical protein [Opitutaceae bacterium]